VPVKRIEGREFDLSAPPDPFFILDLYGDKQFPLALGRYPAKALVEAVAMVRERRPGTGPAGKTMAALIEYLVQHTGN